MLRSLIKRTLHRPCVLCLLILGTLPVSVRAEQPNIDNILLLTPVSGHYVQKVLQRVDAGLANLPSGSGPFTQLLYIRWLDEVSSAVYSLVNTDMRLTTQQRQLMETSACLNIDMLLLETKMEQVRRILHQKLDEGALSSIWRLQNMLEFLNQRMIHLTQGARDNTYEDADWWQVRLFETPTQVYCCIPSNDHVPACTQTTPTVCDQGRLVQYSTMDSCVQYTGCANPSAPPSSGSGTEASTPEKMCPFDSDYLAPVIVGSGSEASRKVYSYGCDETVLENYESISPNLDKELQLMRSIVESREKAAASGAYMQEVTALINDVFQIPVPNDEASQYPYFGTYKNREHRVRLGCSALDGTAIVLPLPSKGAPRWPAGVAKWQTRGPFFFRENTVSLLVELLLLRERSGTLREQPTDLRLTTEYAPGTPERAQAEQRERTYDMLDVWSRDVLRNYTSTEYAKQEERNSSLVVSAIEGVLELSSTFKPLRTTVKSFMEKAGPRQNSVRRFMIDYGYFLRRSCIYRPCNTLLDRVLKVGLADECFPYTDGSYLGNPNLYSACQTKANAPNP